MLAGLSAALQSEFCRHSWSETPVCRGNKADIVEALLLHRTSAGAAGEEVLIAKEEPLVKEEEPVLADASAFDHAADAFAFDHAADPFAAWIHAHELSGKWSLPPKPLITVNILLSLTPACIPTI